MAGLRQLLKPAMPKRGLNWSVTTDQRPGQDALHMHHPEHGTISVVKNPGTGMYDVKHNGAFAGLKGNKGTLPTKAAAYGHAKQYIHGLLSNTVMAKPAMNMSAPSTGAPKFGKEEAGNASANMSPPAKPKSNAQQMQDGANWSMGQKMDFYASNLKNALGMGKEEKNPKTPNADKDMSKPAGPNLDPEKTKAFVSGFNNALGFGKKQVSEVLEKPYRSEAQRRWAHTAAGKEALGGEAGVHEWDEATKGKKLPERVKKTAREAFGQYLRKDDKSSAPKPAAPAESYNPKLERPTQRERVKNYLEEAKADPSKRNINFSISNSKLAKDGIASFNLPAVETCPGAGKCAKYCYADTGSFLRFHKTTMPPRIQNWLAAQGDDFGDRAIQYLDQWKKTGKHPETGKRFPLKAIRIHDSGDFFSPKYIDQWTKIAKAHPDVMLYAYTKSHHPALKQKLKELNDLPNVNIVQSLGSKYDHLVDPDQPHAVVFENPEQMHAAGYADAMSSDLTAADKKNKKVGLYIHGSAYSGYNGLEDHLEHAPELRRRIMAELQNKGVPVGGPVQPNRKAKPEDKS